MTGQPMTQQQISLKPITPEIATEAADEELRDRLCQDGEYVGECLPRSYLYVGCYVYDNLTGFFCIKKITRNIIELHINILKDWRGYASIFVKKITSNLFSDPLINRIESEIPDIYPEMISFAQLMGFKEEGEKRESFLKNGKWHNKKVIGMIRSDHGS